MNKLYFSIYGPDVPSEKQKLPWRLTVYEWTESHKGIIGQYRVLTSYKGPFEFKTLKEVCNAVERIKKELSCSTSMT